VYVSRGVLSDKRGGGIASGWREGGRKGRRESFATAGEGKRSDDRKSVNQRKEKKMKADREKERGI